MSHALELVTLELENTWLIMVLSAASPCVAKLPQISGDLRSVLKALRRENEQR